jgi:D-alanyl-D-alanine carboxypeptidase
MKLLWIWGILCMLLVATPSADARTVTGYAHGQKLPVKLVWVGGVELEAQTAKAFRAMAAAARKAGLDLAIRSGFRSHEKQTELYRDYKKGWGHLAAKPGYSNHQNGKAVDIYIDDYRVYEWLRGNAKKFGFKRTVKREAWHWEYRGGGQRVAARQARR